MTNELIRSVPRGVPLRGVRYISLEWDDPFGGSGFDEVSMAVVLVFEDLEPYVLGWRVWQPLECLTTLPRKGGYESPNMRVVDASERWAHLMGAAVVAQHVGMHMTSWGVQPWSTRLDFDNGHSLVVCLGELTAEDDPTYLPDSLLVTDSREHASAYHLLSTDDSAWVDDPAVR